MLRGVWTGIRLLISFSIKCTMGKWSEVYARGDRLSSFILLLSSFLFTSKIVFLRKHFDMYTLSNKINEFHHYLVQELLVILLH